MKKVNIVSVFIFVLIISFSFLSLQNYKVTGQTGASSSSGGVTQISPSPSASVVASPVVSPTINVEVSPTPTVTETPPPSPSPESSVGGLTLNKNFTGIWKARVERPIGGSPAPSASPEASSSPVLNTATKILAHISDESFGSSIITFKLCVNDEGKLEGIVHQGGVFLTGKITSQTAISENEVEFTAETEDGKTATIHLKLTGDREFIGTFADGHKFKGRKLNDNRGCLAPRKTGRPSPSGTPGESGMSGQGMSGAFNNEGGQSMGGPSMGGPIAGGSPNGEGGPAMSGPGMGGPQAGGSPSGEGSPFMGGSDMSVQPGEGMGGLPPGGMSGPGMGGSDMSGPQVRSNFLMDILL